MRVIVLLQIEFWILRSRCGCDKSVRVEATIADAHSHDDDLLLVIKDSLEPVYDLEARYGGGVSKAIIGRSSVR